MRASRRKLRRKRLAPSPWSQRCRRADNYADSLSGALERANLGKVIGSGADLTVELTDLERGVALIKSELVRLGGIARHNVAVHTQRRARGRVGHACVPGGGKRYRVIKEFADHDRHRHPQGEEWTFLRSAFVPYHSGRSWFVSFDGRDETHIRLQGIPEEQGYEFLVEV